MKQHRLSCNCKTLGAEAPLTVGERRARADSLYSAQRFGEAGDEYRALAGDPQADPALQASLKVAAAACDYRLKRATIAQIEALPDMDSEAGARRLYLLMELARDRGDVDVQQSMVKQLEQRFPTSPWLAEGLYSSGNMYLLRKDFPQAITYYLELSNKFPSICQKGSTDPCSNYAPSAHWRAAWLNYRLGNYSQAAILFDQQIATYPGGKEIPRSTLLARPDLPGSRVSCGKGRCLLPGFERHLSSLLLRSAGSRTPERDERNCSRRYAAVERDTS